ncbi:MAG: metal ABC transporter permease [Saprospiraceae bacterium]|nr:metal ABC transporter permease [Saprospiraceae bacterium]
MMESGLRAAMASILVGGLCGLLGCFIVLRNMSLIGDALSHSILPGIVIAFMFFGYSTTAFFLGSVIAGLVSAFLITLLQNHIRVKNDAAIGIIFTFMFSLGVIGISWLSNSEGVHLDLKDFLFGNVLAVETNELIISAFMAVFVVLLLITMYRGLFTTSFQSEIAATLGFNSHLFHNIMMLMLSLVVVASLRSVGVILVVAMLITPASAALLISDRLPKVMVSSALIGMVSAFTGLLLSILLDTPPGPSMAVVTTLFYLFVVLFSPKRGLVPNWRARQKHEMRVVIEDILKRLLSDQSAKNNKLSELQDRLGHSNATLKKWLKKMKKLGLVQWDGEDIQLTESGHLRAHQLLRAHRLWETFLAEELGLAPDQIHDEAERIEHHLSDEEINEVDDSLGFPNTDPHGSPIPRK